MNAETHRLFEVNVLRYTLPELVKYNDIYTEEIIKYDLKRSGQGKNGTFDYGGRQTTPDLLERPEQAFISLREKWHAIVEEIEQRPVIASQAWGLVIEASDFKKQGSILQIPHEHLPWTISGVYYAKAPKKMDPTKEGGLIFNSPIPFQHKNRKRLPTTEGSLLAFPAYVLHAVEPFSAPGKRICIAMNAITKPI